MPCPSDFLAAISSCHMLSYLELACASDRALGVLREDGRGGGRFEEVVLSPRVTVADASQIARARELHERAHALCFIAASCSVPIHHRAESSAGRGASPVGGW